MIKTTLKKTFIISTTLCLGLCFGNLLFAQEEPSVKLSKHRLNTQADTLVLPPIRRIGIDTVETNVDEFRNFMRKEDRLLHGVVALPFNDQDLRKMLAHDLEEQTKNTGRFWELNLSSFLNILPITTQNEKNKDEKNLQFKQKLELEYNLDAWIKPSIYFAPDQTLIRLSLKGPGISKGNFAREDILLEAQASEDKIKAGFAEALNRIISTIGHDGQITYTRENLMSLDFGKERGVNRGQKIISGYVVLTSFHPQSGEFLRSERIPLYELKVLETNQGSSLCQITAVDKMKLEQIAQNFDSSKLILLAWKDEEKSIKQNGWHEPYNPQTAPILGATESGFGVSLAKKELPLSPISMAEPSLEQKKQVEKKQILQAESNIQNIPANNDVKYSDARNNEFHFTKRSRWDNPSTWKITQLKIGGGIALGSFAEGQASAFPATLLNRLDFRTSFNLDPQLKLILEPYGQYAFYSGLNVSGSSYYLGSKIYNDIWSDRPQDQHVYFGVALEATGGTISKVVDSTNLFNLSISPSFKWISNIPGFGKYSTEGSFSMFDFLQSYPVWDLRAEIIPSEVMAKQFSFNVGLKRFKNDWIEFLAGISWDFLPTYSGVSNK